MSTSFVIKDEEDVKVRLNGDIRGTQGIYVFVDGISEVGAEVSLGVIQDGVTSVKGL